MLDVLVVGAGPSGLTAALVLAKNGIKKIRVIEKLESYQVGSRGFGVQPRTFELFKMLGILDEVEKKATPIPTMHAYKLPEGTQVVKEWDLYPKAKAWPDRPFAGGRCVSQDDLEAIMRKKLTELGVEVELGKALTAIEQDDGGVTATITHYKNKGPTQETEVLRAKFLLGCDGARGVSRKLLGLSFEGETRYAEGQVWGDVEIDGLTNDFWHIWGQPGKCTIMIRPKDLGSSSSKRFHVGITGHSFDPAERQLDETDKVEAFIRENTGRKDLKFGAWTSLSRYRPNMRMVNTFQNGRAFCVGDSAHVHPPNGGQGMNNSVQDALNICWKLSLVIKGYTAPSLLKTYDEERLPIIALMLQASTKLYTISMVSRIEKKTELPSGAAPASQSAVSAPDADNDKESGWFRWRNDALELYGVNYRFSSIVYDERAPLGHSQDDIDHALARAYAGYEGSGTLAAGDRLPDAPGIRRLFGTSNTTWTLLDLFQVNLHTVLVFPDEEMGDRGEALTEIEPVLDLCDKYPTDAVHAVVLVPMKIAHAWPPVYRPDGTLKVFGDFEGHARNAYRVGKGMTVVIARPDGYVGAVVFGVKGVEEYFSKIFSK